MRIVCAPDSFKESLTAREGAEAMARGLRAALGAAAGIDLCPIADGGEGTVEALVTATGGTWQTSAVAGPLPGQRVEARWGLLGDGTAAIEMAAASGLHLVRPTERDPQRTTTFGTGELIRAALGAGAKRIILGIGGSATTDGGTGAAQALGVRFLDADGRELPGGLTGGDLGRIAAVDPSGRDPRLAGVELLIACDVTNPLTGPRGAAAVYGPQKGATAEQVARLDAGLASLARVVGIDPQMPGAGAAGGLGYAAVALLGGTLRRGIDLVLEAVGFEQRVRGADLVLTGEGRMDGQTLAGKAIAGVAGAAKKHGVPVVALVGSVGEGVERVREIGVVDWRVIGDGLSREESMRRAAELMEKAAGEVAERWGVRPHRSGQGNR